MIFIGQLNDPYATAGVGLAIVYINCSVANILTGFNNAISVLVAVAYGKKDMQECKTVFHRGRVICFICYVPLFLVAINCSNVLEYLAVEPLVAENAQRYAMYLYCAMGFHTQFDCYR